MLITLGGVPCEARAVDTSAGLKQVPNAHQQSPSPSPLPLLPRNPQPTTLCSAHSNQLNAARIEILKAQDEHLQGIFAKVKSHK